MPVNGADTLIDPVTVHDGCIPVIVGGVGTLGVAVTVTEFDAGDGPHVLVAVIV